MSSSDCLPNLATGRNENRGGAPPGSQNRNDSSSSSDSESSSSIENDSGNSFVVEDDTENDDNLHSTVALHSALRSIQHPRKRARRLPMHPKCLQKTLRERPNVEELADSDSSSSLVHSPLAQKNHLRRMAVCTDDESDGNSNGKMGEDERHEQQSLISVSSTSSSQTPSHPPTPDVGVDADEDTYDPPSFFANPEPQDERKAPNSQQPTAPAPLSSPSRKRPRRHAAPLTFFDAFGYIAPASAKDRRARAVAFARRQGLSDKEDISATQNQDDLAPNAIASKGSPQHCYNDCNNEGDCVKLNESTSEPEQLTRVEPRKRQRQGKSQKRHKIWGTLRAKIDQIGQEECSLDRGTKYLPLQLHLDGSIPIRDDTSGNRNNSGVNQFRNMAIFHDARRMEQGGDVTVYNQCDEGIPDDHDASGNIIVQDLGGLGMDNQRHSDERNILTKRSAGHLANGSRTRRRRAAKLVSVFDADHPSFENSANCGVISLLESDDSKSDGSDGDDEDDEWDDLVSTWRDEIVHDVQTFAIKCEGRLEEVRYDCVSSMGSRAHHVFQYVARTLGVRVCTSTAEDCMISLVKPNAHVVKLSPGAARRVAEQAVKRTFLACSRANQRNLTQEPASMTDFGAVVDVDCNSSEGGDSDVENDNYSGPSVDADESATSDRLDEWGETIDEEVRGFVRKCGQHAKVDAVEYRFHIWGGMSAMPVVNHVAQVLGCAVGRGGTAARPEFILRKPANVSLRTGALHASQVIRNSVISLRRLRNGHSVIDVDGESPDDTESHRTGTEDDQNE